MSIGALPIGNAAIAAQATAKPEAGSPPHKRTIVASPDRVARPEPR